MAAMKTKGDWVLKEMSKALIDLKSLGGNGRLYNKLLDDHTIILQVAWH